MEEKELQALSRALTHLVFRNGIVENLHANSACLDDKTSSLSAILLNDAYYDLLKDGQVILDGSTVLKEVCLIPFKAKAWLDLTERKQNGESVDSKNIKKHKNDVFRLGQLITAESRQALDEEIVADMKRFLNEMEKENVDLKALGIRGFGQEAMISMLRNCYGIE